MSAAPAPLVIHEHLLPYESRLVSRHRDAIEGIVVHCTETPDLALARNFGERVLYAASGTGNSGHYYIDRDGRIECFVAPERIAHHVRGQNANTLGIELVNRGRYPRWYDSDHQAMTEPYPSAQIDALTALIRQIKQGYPNVYWIAGHEDLDTEWVPANDDSTQRIARKRDPGPLFPWERVVSEGGLERIGGFGAGTDPVA